jgi:hypothetical protein
MRRTFGQRSDGKRNTTETMRDGQIQKGFNRHIVRTEVVIKRAGEAWGWDHGGSVAKFAVYLMRYAH